MLWWLDGSFQIWSDMYHMLSGKKLLYLVSLLLVMQVVRVVSARQRIWALIPYYLLPSLLYELVHPLRGFILSSVLWHYCCIFRTL